MKILKNPGYNYHDVTLQQMNSFHSLHFVNVDIPTLESNSWSHSSLILHCNPLSTFSTLPSLLPPNLVKELTCLPDRYNDELPLFHQRVQPTPSPPSEVMFCWKEEPVLNEMEYEKILKMTIDCIPLTSSTSVSQDGRFSGHLNLPLDPPPTSFPIFEPPLSNVFSFTDVPVLDSLPTCSQSTSTSTSTSTSSFTFFVDIGSDCFSINTLDVADMPSNPCDVTSDYHVPKEINLNRDSLFSKYVDVVINNEAHVCGVSLSKFLTKFDQIISADSSYIARPFQQIPIPVFNQSFTGSILTKSLTFEILSLSLPKVEKLVNKFELKCRSFFGALGNPVQLSSILLPSPKGTSSELNLEFDGHLMIFTEDTVDGSGNCYLSDVEIPLVSHQLNVKNLNIEKFSLLPKKPKTFELPTSISDTSKLRKNDSNVLNIGNGVSLSMRNSVEQLLQKSSRSPQIITSSINQIPATCHSSDNQDFKMEETHHQSIDNEISITSDPQLLPDDFDLDDDVFLVDRDSISEFTDNVTSTGTGLGKSLSTDNSTSVLENDLESKYFHQLNQLPAQLPLFSVQNVSYLPISNLLNNSNNLEPLSSMKDFNNSTSSDLDDLMSKLSAPKKHHVSNNVNKESALNQEFFSDAVKYYMSIKGVNVSKAQQQLSSVLDDVSPQSQSLSVQLNDIPDSTSLEDLKLSVVDQNKKLMIVHRHGRQTFESCIIPLISALSTFSVVSDRCNFWQRFGVTNFISFSDISNIGNNSNLIIDVLSWYQLEFINQISNIWDPISIILLPSDLVVNPKIFNEFLNKCQLLLLESCLVKPPLFNSIALPEILSRQCLTVVVKAVEVIDPLLDDLQSLIALNQADCSLSYLIPFSFSTQSEKVQRLLSINPKDLSNQINSISSSLNDVSSDDYNDLFLLLLICVLVYATRSSVGLLFEDFPSTASSFFKSAVKNFDFDSSQLRPYFISLINLFGTLDNSDEYLIF
ncbi:hypothetical protein GEMRC1_010338 [Eukaryota sp. GEM-RC1]